LEKLSATVNAQALSQIDVYRQILQRASEAVGYSELSTIAAKSDKKDWHGFECASFSQEALQHRLDELKIDFKVVIAPSRWLFQSESGVDSSRDKPHFSHPDRGYQIGRNPSITLGQFEKSVGKIEIIPAAVRKSNTIGSYPNPRSIVSKAANLSQPPNFD
jgi:hypothetical protein